ncbi:MAG: PAS domain S-box protein, partial [Proteobacteria bacterium]
LLVRDDSRTWSYRTIGLREDQLRLLPSVGRTLAQRLRFTAETRTPYTVTVAQVLDSEASGSALVTPIVHRGNMLGAVVLGIGDRLDDHRVAFAGVVAGQIALVLALARSFRDLERASADERARAQVLTSVLDAIGEPLLVLDADGFPSHANRAAQHLEIFRAHGTADNSVQLGLYHADLSTLYSHDDLPTTRALRGEEVEDEELVIRRPTGDPKWMSVTARPIRGDDAKIDGVVAVIRDITQEKRSQAQQIASDRLASIGVLAAGIAHEINNPLTSVIAELDMAIEDTESTHRSMDRLQAARDAASRVQTIVRDLRTLSRNETEDTAAPVELGRVLDTALRMAVPQTRQFANVVREVDDVPLVLGNEARLVQVFLNLIVNAAQAIPPGDIPGNSIRVRAREVNNGVTVEVTDTGSGMTPDVRLRLFTPFFTTKPVGKGTGLGLSISHRIINAAGGTIDCESTPGKGTTFRVWLPRAPVGTRREPAPRSMSSVEVRMRILVIDEDPLAFQIISRALRPEHEVVQAKSPGAALERLATDTAFDVVLCDVETHGDSCREFYEEICRRLPELGPRVAFLHGGSGPEVQDLPRPSLNKPFDGPTLRRFLREHVASIARGDSS